MASIKCFMLTPAGRIRRSLRRYIHRGDEDNCALSGTGYHNAECPIEDGPLVENEKGYINMGADWPRDDPRWPQRCACGYEFREEDHWQLFVKRIYLAPDGTEHTLFDAPAGAMWYADWMSDVWRGPDGHCLVVKTPAGDWMIDGPATGGGRWTRTGEPPNVTARPSIGIGDPMRYHGFLTDGELVEV